MLGSDAVISAAAAIANTMPLPIMFLLTLVAVREHTLHPLNLSLESYHDPDGTLTAGGKSLAERRGRLAVLGML